jgi:hypothetical protein
VLVGALAPARAEQAPTPDPAVPVDDDSTAVEAPTPPAEPEAAPEPEPAAEPEPVPEPERESAAPEAVPGPEPTPERAAAALGPKPTPAAPAASGVGVELVAPPGPRRVEVTLRGEFLTLANIQSDSDFDPTERYYDVDGQTEGHVATYFRPEVELRVIEALRILYEAELGWNVWSRNNSGQPNEYFPANQPGLNLRHRQLWAAYRFSEAVDFRVGYQELVDPSRIFLDYLGGAARLDLSFNGWDGTVWVGQLPDSTYEGVEPGGDNFVTDSVFGGLQSNVALGAFTLETALYGVGDFRLVDRELYLATLVVGGRYKSEHLTSWAHLLAQGGSWQNSGVNGAAQTILAWAAQAGVGQNLGRFSWTANVLALSPDDNGHGNELFGAFFSSAKNRSSTLMLTENEFRDRYDNYDERMASAWGPFFYNRAGLVVADLSVAYRLTNWYEPRLVAGGALAMNPHNAMGHRLVGFEGALLNQFIFGDHVMLFCNLQFLVPGGALSAHVNDVDREARRTVVAGEAGFAARF